MASGTLVLGGGLRSVARVPPDANEDKRYNLKRWHRLRAAILDRDLHRCRVVPGCPRRAQVVDHIQPVYRGMPDAAFFDPKNLRASCKAHNLRRGHVARFVRETGGAVVTTDYTSRPDDVA